MSKRTIKNYFFTTIFLALAACAGGGGGCNSCAMEELPEGGLPSDQTLEGGAQLRISENGFAKLTDIIPALINDAFSNGTCTGPGDFGVLVGDIDYCYQNDGSCTPGCEFNVNIDNIDLSVPQDDQLRVGVQFDITADVPVSFDPIIGGTRSCVMIASANNMIFDMILSFDINPDTGELELNLEEIEDIDISLDVDASDCGVIVDAVASLTTTILNGLGSVLGVGFVRDLLTPVIEPIVQGMLPDPLGIEGMADLGSLLAGVAPQGSAKLETRVVPGGYVHLENGGLSLGLITGFNADQDISTRTPELDSEPARCVPPFPAPDFAAAPALLSQSVRNNFMLNPADVFRGIPETGKDVIIGASETMLDQLGHHLVSSGALCINVGTAFLPQLNLATIGIFVPSLAELGSDEGNDPLLMAMRPAKPIDFSIGDGTEESPSIVMHLNEFSIDFYAFIFERYVRGFTITLDMDIGINIDFSTDENGNAAIMPILVGLEAQSIGLTVSNEEFLLEDKATLETVFPILLDLVLPVIGDNLGSFALPDIAGFRLDNLSMESLSTSEDDFVAISGSLVAGAMMQTLGKTYPSLGRAIKNMKLTTGLPAQASARLIRVIAPSPKAMLAKLKHQVGGQAPQVILDLDTHDQAGRELEWTWNLEGGLWRPFIGGGQVSLEDGAFYAQGKYQIELRSRAIGDYHSWAPQSIYIDIVIDSLGPRILVNSLTQNTQGVQVSAFDQVFEHDVQIAFGQADSTMATTRWSDGFITNTELLTLSKGGEFRVFAKDPQGNQSTALLQTETSKDLGSTSGCSTSSNSNLAGLLLVLAALFLPLILRQKKQGRLVAQSLAQSALFLTLLFTGACNCGSDPSAFACELDEECREDCMEGEVGQCFEGLCRCLDDIPYGNIGQYSSMDVASDGTIWVSAYNRDHGDLMVTSTSQAGRIPVETWQFIDGVPDGPVLLPADANRNGIKSPGDDVGQYTDLAVAHDGTVMISYFDATQGSLKFASNSNGAWQTHTVDAGTLGSDGLAHSRVAGQYSSISIASDGTPTIAYFVHADIGSEEASTQVRLAQASSNTPLNAVDWNLDLLEEVLVPTAEAEADILTIPYGTGLFIEIVRDQDDMPLLVYYDRINGDLKLARTDNESGEFIIETLDSQGDVGRYPSVVVDTQNVAHVSYVDASNWDLLYINDNERTPELVDDGYRIVGTTENGLPIPEFHFVGDDSSIVLTSQGVHIAYQDATTHELLVTYPANGSWARSPIAGHEEPFVGAYGFFTNAAILNSNDITLSSWVLDQRNADAWVEIFQQTFAIQ